MTSNTAIIDLARSYWDAESRRDTGAVLAHYADDATFTHPGGTLTGHQEIATFYDGSGADYPGLEVRIVHSVVGDEEAAIEWDAVLTDRDGRRHPLKGVNVIRVQHGRFATVRAYFDPASLDDTIGDD